MRSLISVRQVRKYFALSRPILSREQQRYVRAVDGVDLELGEDETLALVGESGSGKTTLGLLILALHQPTAGTIAWDGKPFDQLRGDEWKRFRRDVQVIFQDPYGSLNPRLTVSDILRRPMRLHGIVPSKMLDDEAERLLEIVGLRPADSYIDRYPHEFSGGQRQRIAIARALSLRPRVIVADEPVSALDVSVRAQILNLLKRLKQELKLSMLFTTHDLGVVRFVADRVAVMYLGKLVEVAAVEVLFRGPHHPYARMLLGSALSPNPEVLSTRPPIQVLGEPPSPIDPPSGCRFRTRCPHVFGRCEEEPPLRPLDDGHWSACHLREGG